MYFRNIARAISIFISVLSLAGFAIAQMTDGPAEIQAPSQGYVAEFISTAATGIAMNSVNTVTGTSYPDQGCGWQCLPPLDTVVWKNGVRIVLPAVPGFSSISVTGLNSQGWVTGYAGLLDTTTHAVVWKPNGNTYVAVDIGTLPGTTASIAVGIDESGRVIGYSKTLTFPPTGAPFLWSEAGGMVDLSLQGFPNEAPIGISPGGTVALSNRWYRLGDPNSVVTMAPQPQGFFPPGAGAVINDAGDQARFLASTSSQNLAYLFRYSHEGVWQQIGFNGNGHLLPYGLGSISPTKDVTATDHGDGVVAYGPTGVEQNLSGLLSPAYQGAAVTRGGPMNSYGQILAQVMIGRSSRLMRLVPAQSCVTGCIKLNTLQITGEFIDDPNDPGHCTDKARDHVVVDLEMTNKTGTKLPGVQVRGRFLDDYWMDKPVSGVTNANGMVSFIHDGLACVGAVAFLADSAAATAITIRPAPTPERLDKTVGILTGFVIPMP